MFTLAGLAGLVPDDASMEIGPAPVRCRRCDVVVDTPQSLVDVGFAPYCSARCTPSSDGAALKVLPKAYRERT